MQSAGGTYLKTLKQIQAVSKNIKSVDTAIIEQVHTNTTSITALSGRVSTNEQAIIDQNLTIGAVEGEITNIYENIGLINTEQETQNTNIQKLQEQKDAQGIPNGLLQPSRYFVNYTSGTLTLTISAETQYCIQNDVYTQAPATLNFTLNQVGLYYLYYDAPGSIVCTQTIFNILNHTTIFTIYYRDTNNILVFEERHGNKMSDETHRYFHLFQGTQLRNGCVVSFPPLSINWTSTQGIILDEDLETICAAVDGSSYRFLYLSGTEAAPVWNWIDRNIGLYQNVSNQTFFNEVSGGNWILSPLTSNVNYLVQYIIAVPTVSSGPQILTILSQKQYTTLSSAEQDYDIKGLGFLLIEGIILYKNIYYRTTTKLVSSTKINKSLVQSTVPISGTGNVLASQVEILQNGQTLITETNLQSAIEKIDTEIVANKTDIENLQNNQNDILLSLSTNGGVNEVLTYTSEGNLPQYLPITGQIVVSPGNSLVQRDDNSEIYARHLTVGQTGIQTGEIKCMNQTDSTRGLSLNMICSNSITQQENGDFNVKQRGELIISDINDKYNTAGTTIQSKAMNVDRENMTLHMFFFTGEPIGITTTPTWKGTENMTLVQKNTQATQWYYRLYNPSIGYNYVYHETGSPATVQHMISFLTWGNSNVVNAVTSYGQVTTMNNQTIQQTISSTSRRSRIIQFWSTFGSQQPTFGAGQTILLNNFQNNWRQEVVERIQTGPTGAICEITVPVSGSYVCSLSVVIDMLENVNILSVNRLNQIELRNVLQKQYGGNGVGSLFWPPVHVNTNLLLNGQTTDRPFLDSKRNVFIGGFDGIYTGGISRTSASANIAIGHSCLNSITTGQGNICIGQFCGQAITNSNFNIVIGQNACGALLTGAGNNIYLAPSSGYSSANSASYECLIGNSTAKGNQTCFLAYNNIYNASNTTTFAVTSDERIKKNIVPLPSKLNGLKQLQLKQYEYKTKEECPEFVKDEMPTGIQTGLIAQQLQQIFPECIKIQDNGLLNIDYGPLNLYLLQSVQEIYQECKEQSIGEVFLCSNKIRPTKGKHIINVCDGSYFDMSEYNELYVSLGTNQLPNIQQPASNLSYYIIMK